MKPRHPTHDQVSPRFYWSHLPDQMIVAVVILGTMLLISWGCWAYLDFHGLVSGLVGLVSGLGLGIFWILVAIREMETIEEQSGFALESVTTKEKCGADV